MRNSKYIDSAYTESCVQTTRISVVENDNRCSAGYPYVEHELKVTEMIGPPQDDYLKLKMQLAYISYLFIYVFIYYYDILLEFNLIN